MIKPLSYIAFVKVHIKNRVFIQYMLTRNNKRTLLNVYAYFLKWD